MANAVIEYAAGLAFIPLDDATDWDAETLGTGVQQLSDPLWTSGSVSKVIAVTIVVPDAAITNDVTFTVLKETSTGVYQDPASLNDNFRRYPIDITQNQTTKWTITLYAVDLSNYLIEMDNQSGQTLTISIMEDLSSITPAS